MSRQSEIRQKLEKADDLEWTKKDLRIVCQRGIVAECPTPTKGGMFDCQSNSVLIANAPSDLRYLLDRLEAATRLLQLAREELAVGRRFLPKHGSFGEEGIDNYEYTQRVVEQFLKESQ